MHSHDTNQSNICIAFEYIDIQLAINIIDGCGFSNELHFELHKSKG